MENPAFPLVRQKKKKKRFFTALTPCSAHRIAASGVAAEAVTRSLFPHQSSGIPEELGRCALTCVSCVIWDELIVSCKIFLCFLAPLRTSGGDSLRHQAPDRFRDQKIRGESCFFCSSSRKEDGCVTFLLMSEGTLTGTPLLVTV